MIGVLFALICSIGSVPMNNGPAEIRSNASVTDWRVQQLIADLSNKDVQTIQNQYYETVYFPNLKSNFGLNTHGTCNYVALGMLLSFYDTYWDDSFIPETYDQGETYTIGNSESDFALPSYYSESPGIKMEPYYEVANLNDNEYLNYVNKNKNVYFQSKLIDLSLNYFGDAKFESSTNPFGMTMNELSDFTQYYLYHYLGFSKQNIEVTVETNKANLRNFLANNILSGTPVLIRVESDSIGAHTMIAFDCNNNGSDFRVHTGWINENGQSITNVGLKLIDTAEIIDAMAITINSSHLHSDNYISPTGSKGCACMFAFPQEIEIDQTTNYRDKNPTFAWKSLIRETWYDYPTKFKLSFLSNNRYEIFSTYSTENQITLTSVQWDSVLYANNSGTYFVYAELCSDAVTGLDDYYSIAEFSKPTAYKSIPVLEPNKYGFKDEYPEDSETKNVFEAIDQQTDIKVETRRFRTGYIHDEYIVMSPISEGVSSAFIEYRFSTAISRIDVQLSHWRPFSSEWLDSDSGTAQLSIYGDEGWEVWQDLLSPDFGMPQDRSQIKTFTFTFDRPIYRLKFSADVFEPIDTPNNKGRICIGDMAIYPTEYNMALSGSELNYNPNYWSTKLVYIEEAFSWKELEKVTNCYSYAVNSELNPVTMTALPMQPGLTTDTPLTPEKAELIKLPNYVRSLIEKDAEKLGFEFLPVPKETPCQAGRYKVALCLDDIGYDLDYHWYRQNPDGSWPHKPGGESVTNKDSSGRLILDPENCSKDYSYTNNYTNFVGFFSVKPLNIYAPTEPY